MSALLILIALLPMGIAAHQYITALVEIEPLLPIQLRDRPISGVAINTYIWNMAAPASARWQYLRFLLCLGIASALFAAAVFVADQLIPALYFGGLSLALIVYFLTQRIRYSARL